VGAWGIQPNVFWDMDPQEWFWLFDMKRTDKPVAGSSLTETDLLELYELIK
jgi:hypothetical protein